MITFALVFVYPLSFNANLNIYSDSKMDIAPTYYEEGLSLEDDLSSYGLIFSSNIHSYYGKFQYFQTEANHEKCGYSKYVGDSPIVGY